MNMVTRTLPQAAAGVALVRDPAALSVLKAPECAAAVWQRTPPPEVMRWLDGLSPEHLPQGRVILRPNAVAGAVRQLCDIAELRQGPERDWLEADIADLAALFSELMSVKYLRLRLSAVSTNACRKFHVDALTARLVCTYRGQGTQYGVGSPQTDPTEIIQVATGEPILLRGTLWPSEGSPGVLHRSPPIEGTGETRLVLVLDPVFDPGEDP